jgi:copper chaperone NosL
MSLRLMRPALVLLAALVLAACKEEVADIPDPVPMTAEVVGHYCQMNLLEHPGPKAQVHLDGLPGMPLFFSQVRDAVAYQRMPEQSHAITAIYVSDMARAPSWEDPGAENWVRADLAHFVVGAVVPGGMGAPELVPFGTAEAAATFAAEHGGQVLALSAIADATVLAPVEMALDENGDFIAPEGAGDH